MKKTIIAACILAMPVCAMAQSGTNSPYSQYGLGLLSEQSTGFNRGMNGLSYGFHEHNQVNFQNPASYSALDSLTFILDAGVGLQLTNFEENGRKKNAKNADFEYAVAAFRAAKHVGVSFGIMPYTNVGYNYSNTANVNAFSSTQSVNATYTNTYDGDGGIHQVYVGAGWEPIKRFSIGFNAAFIWGDITRSVVNSYNDSYVNTLSKYYKTQVNSYKITLGAQYTHPIGKDNWMTLGLVYEPGHKTNSDPECLVISSNSQTSVNDTARYSINNGISVPDLYGAGLLWNYKNQIKLGFDWQMQKWSKIGMPEYVVSNNKASFTLVDGEYKNRNKFTFGGEYCKGEMYRSIFSRIHYRAGVSYASSYYKINGMEGPKEMSASIGLGIPIINGYNNRSILNISAQWVRLDAKNLIKENTFRITIGLTFNERWFAKFKVE